MKKTSIASERHRGRHRLRTLVLGLSALGATLAAEARSDAPAPEPDATCMIGTRARSGAVVSKAGGQAQQVTESEPNDTPATANPIAVLGTAPGRDSAVEVLGGFDLAPPAVLVPVPEDDGSIPLATPTGLAAGEAVRVDGHIGDGPFGSAGAGSGDFDFYAVTGMSAGQILDVKISGPSGPGDVNAFGVIWTSQGLFADVLFPGAVTRFTAPADGDYFVSIGGNPSFVPADPFDSSSGSGAGSEGDYELFLGLDYFQEDFFALSLRRGDVLSAVVDGAGRSLRLFDASGAERLESRSGLELSIPAGSPVATGGNADLAEIVEETGTWVIGVEGAGNGPYTLELGVSRPALESAAPGDLQTIFLDFDGAAIDVEALLGSGNPNAVLSPLASFLGDWGLTVADLDAVIDAIVATVEENMVADIGDRGANGDFSATGIPGQFALRILNSRDHADPFGDPHVSRVIVGGTQAEAGIGTIGIAPSVDVGNFATEETALVLLDQVSSPAGNPISINSLPLAPGASIVDLIGVVVGNLVSHEAGHVLGNFHTSSSFADPSLMDTGFFVVRLLAGLGDDGVFGTADDVDADFGADPMLDVMTGIEDSLDSVAFGAATPAADTVVIDGCDSGAPNLFPDGISPISDAIADCAADASNHGRFVVCVARLARSLRRAGLISRWDKFAITICAAHSSIP